MQSESEGRLVIVDEAKLTKKENVCPGMYAYVILALDQDNSNLECRCMRWGLCRSWEKSLTSPWRAFNARCESVLLKPMFKQLMPTRRCVVPIDGFYEFKKLENGKKQPYYLFSNDSKHRHLLLAGLYDTWVDDRFWLRMYGKRVILHCYTFIHRLLVVMDMETRHNWIIAVVLNVMYAPVSN